MLSVDVVDVGGVGGVVSVGCLELSSAGAAAGFSTSIASEGCLLASSAASAAAGGCSPSMLVVDK